MGKDLEVKEDSAPASAEGTNSFEYANEHILNGNACIECGFRCIQGCV